MGIIYALLAALFWGIMPLIIKKVNGSPANGILGTTIGALIVSILIQFIIKPQKINLIIFIICLLSGACWVIGQIGQFAAYNMISVTTTMPISTAMQLIGTSLIGVFVFNEWPGTLNKIVGFIDIILLIIGVIFTTIGDEKKSKLSQNKNIIKGLLVLIFTSIGYWIYSVIPKVISFSGSTIFLPEMMGAFIAAFIYSFIVDHKIIIESKTWKDIFAGILWSIAAFLYILSAKLIGIATSFTITQLCVVISTLGGIFFLHEQKNRKEMIFTIIGLILVVMGGAITSFI